jgi:hypothetical protein
MYKKKFNFPKKSINMLSILKMKRAKNSYGDFFPGTFKNFKLRPKLLENIPAYTKENRIKSKLILINIVLYKK